MIIALNNRTGNVPFYLYNLPFLPMTLRALTVVNGEFIAVYGWLVYSGAMGLNMETHPASKKYKNVEGMNTRKLLLTGLAVFSISLGAMAQERHD